jgi:hypothetical protein
MAIRFAKQAGNWSDVNTWDDGLTIPTTGDEVYLNNYNITIDQDVTTGFIANSITPIGVPLDPIPDMTSNTSPVGVGQAFAALGPNLDAWKPFRKGITTFLPTTDGWLSTAANVGQVGFQFNSAKSIQRYAWYSNQQNANYRPRNWTFEGSNDGTTWVILHTVTNATNAAAYYSPNISNPSSYTYYRINVTATQGGWQIFLNGLSMTESTSLGNGYLSGGTATISTSRTVNANLYHAAATSLITVSANTPNVITFTGNMPGTVATATARGILISGTCTVNYIGDIFAGDVANINGTTGIQASNGTLNITGNVTGGTNNGNAPNTAGVRASSGIINIVGNVYSTTTGARDNYGILNGNGATINITGQLYSSPTSNSLLGNGNWAINLLGITITSTVTIVGGINAANGTPAIYGPTNTSTIILYGDAVNSSNGTMASMCTYLFLENVNSWEFRKSNLTTNTLYTPGVATGHPATNNVRTGIVYGPTNNLTGTCAVPPSGSVTLGVPVDNTTGTAYTDPTALAAAFFTEISGSSDPLAQRMRNQATVQTTGDQIAALM